VYTQCPDCATVFRVTAEALRIAQGDVRCGVCATSFNALENLSEQPFRPAPESDTPSPDDSMTVEELPGNENIELSAPVELAAVPDPSPAKAPANDSDEEPDDEARAMEFHGSAADLDRLFVVEDSALQRFEPAEVTAEPDDAERANDLDSTDEHPILVLDERDELPEVAATVEPDEVVEEEGESIVLETLGPIEAPLPAVPRKPAAANLTAPRILIPDEMRRRLAAEASARATAAREFEPEDSSDGFLSQRWPWVAANDTRSRSPVSKIVCACGEGWFWQPRVVAAACQSDAWSVSVPLTSRARPNGAVGESRRPLHAVPAGVAVPLSTPLASRQRTKSTACWVPSRRRQAPSSPGFHDALNTVRSPE